MLPRCPSPLTFPSTSLMFRNCMYQLSKQQRNSCKSGRHSGAVAVRQKHAMIIPGLPLKTVEFLSAHNATQRVLKSLTLHIKPIIQQTKSNFHSRGNLRGESVSSAIQLRNSMMGTMRYICKRHHTEWCKFKIWTIHRFSSSSSTQLSPIAWNDRLSVFWFMYCDIGPSHPKHGYKSTILATGIQTYWNEQTWLVLWSNVSFAQRISNGIMINSSNIQGTAMHIESETNYSQLNSDPAKILGGKRTRIIVLDGTPIPLILWSPAIKLS